jgi:RHS repeat-associated protein
VAAVEDSTNNVIERYAYTPYGDVKVLNDDFSDATSNVSGIANTHFYTGRERDAETGLQLNRWRFYEPPLGRWLQRDPIEYEGGLDLYEYVRGRATLGRDPLGLKMQKLPGGAIIDQREYDRFNDDILEGNRPTARIIVRLEIDPRSCGYCTSYSAPVGSMAGPLVQHRYCEGDVKVRLFYRAEAVNFSPEFHEEIPHYDFVNQEGDSVGTFWDEDMGEHVIHGPGGPGWPGAIWWEYIDLGTIPCRGGAVNGPIFIRRRSAGGIDQRVAVAGPGANRQRIDFNVTIAACGQLTNSNVSVSEIPGPTPPPPWWGDQLQEVK